jgi:trans-aconitate methyltransferase
MKYETPDPWGFKVNRCDGIRREKIIQCIDKNAETIVDLGCGEGFVTEEIAKRFCYSLVIGVEISEKALDRCDFPGMAYQLDIFKDDLSELTKGGPHDFVLATGVLYEATGEEIERLLALVKPGGRFLSCHIVNRPHGEKHIGEPPSGWTVEHWEKFPYREFTELLIVIRRDDDISVS